jgi:aminomethyltransferase
MPDRTSLYDAHRAAGARFIEFGGWEMPLQYAGIVEEHLAVRSSVGLFDVGHMGKLFVEGPGASAFLDGLSANALPAKPGRARYTHLLREDATILDDVIVTCLDANRYFVVCNAGPRPAVVEWLGSRARDGVRDGVRVTDVTTRLACIAVQGPRALELIGRLTPARVDALRPFDATVLEFHAPGARPSAAGRVPPEMKGWGRDLHRTGMEGASASTGDPSFLFTRTGYTGEPGGEIFPPASTARRMWDGLLAAGAHLGVRPIGLGARDTLRLEKGYLLSGQDFDGRQSPLETNSEWLVKWDRPFLGREALLAQRARGDHPRLVGLRTVDRGIPRHGHPVHAESGERVGTVTSGTMSPSLRVGIALASVGPRHAAMGTSLRVEIRGARLEARVVELPFL